MGSASGKPSRRKPQVPGKLRNNEGGKHAVSAFPTFSNHEMPVDLADFEYFEPLGKGGFGRVIRVKHRLTGTNYAMKILPKARLLDWVQEDESIDDLIIERNTYIVCDSPFITKMDFAMQTEDHAIMVMELVSGARLSDLVRGNGYMSEEQVRFYIAQIALALHHLHEKNLMYRDIKMDNMLIGSDGYIRMVDMGLVCQSNEEQGFPWEETYRSTEHSAVTSATGKLPLRIPGASNSGAKSDSSDGEHSLPNSYSSTSSMDGMASHQRSRSRTESTEDGSARSRTSSTSSSRSGSEDKRTKPRRMTAVGTPGYISPEALRLSVYKEQCPSQVYGPASDMWSLGVLTYKLLVGSKPFPEVEFATRMNDYENGRGRYHELLAVYEHVVSLPMDLTSEVCDLITSLLDFNPQTRLGCGKAGFESFKRHPFFRNFDWAALESKQMPAPSIENVKTRKTAREPVFGSYEAAVKGLEARYGGVRDVDSWWEPGGLTEEEQHEFSAWNFVNPALVRQHKDAYNNGTLYSSIRSAGVAGGGGKAGGGGAAAAAPGRVR